MSEARAAPGGVVFRSAVALALLWAGAASAEVPGPAREGLARDLRTLAERKVFIAHNSVGGQMLKGVAALAEELGVPLAMRYQGDLAGFDGFSHGDVGDNGKPFGKVDDFVGRLMPRFGGKAQYAAMKLCYVDFSYAPTPQQIFERYKAGMARARAANPGVTLVHMTAPLCNAADAKGDPKSALAREQFNRLLRAEYRGKEPVFDLALAQATDAAGAVQTATLALPGSPKVQVEAPAWTAGGDNCHLQPAGQRHVGAALVRFLASLPAR